MMYWYIKKAFEEIYGIVTEHKELNIAPQGLDDIPAIIYVVADSVAFFENKDRYIILSDFYGWLFNEYYYMGLFENQDALKEYIDHRIDFYASLGRRRIAGLWVLDNPVQFDNTLKDPIKRITMAFIDCLIDPTYIDDYDNGRPSGDINPLHSIAIGTTLLFPVTAALENLAKAVISKC